MKNFYQVAAIALCLAGLLGEAGAQAERASSPRPSRQVPNDPLKPIPQTNKTLINDVELRDRLPAAPPDNEEANVEEAIPSSLAKALARAMHSNPDVLLAVARLDEVRAERDRMRLKVVEQVSQAIHDIEANRDEHYSLRRRRADKTAPEQGKSEGTLQAELAGIWSHLGYLLGAGVDEKPDDSKGHTSAEALAQSLSGDLTNALTRALRSNPDLRLAESKIRAAEAELNQIRLETARKVAIAFHRRQNDMQVLEVFEARHGSGNALLEELAEPRQAVAESEAELLYLMGAGADAANGTQPSRLPAASTDEPKTVPAMGKRPELPEKLRDSLSKKVSWAQNPASVELAVHLLTSHCDVRIVATNSVAPVAVNIGPVSDLPVLAILEMLADQTGCAFIVRDYGLLAIHRADAWQYSGAAIPSDVPSTPDGAKGR